MTITLTQTHQASPDTFLLSFAVTMTVTEWLDLPSSLHELDSLDAQQDTALRDLLAGLEGAMARAHAAHQETTP
jgi:hypothetical protein